MAHRSIQQQSMEFRLRVWQSHPEISQLFSDYELKLLKYQVEIGNTYYKIEVGPKVSNNSYGCSVGDVIKVI